MLFVIFKYVFRAIALITGITAAWLFYGDISTDAPSVLAGQFWFKLAPSSLQVAEAVVSRYIDPCGLVMSLGCSPFLWHPVISGILQQSAALVFAISAVIFWLVSRFFNSENRMNKALRREGR